MEAVNKKLDQLVLEYEISESKKEIEFLELSLKLAKLELSILELSKPSRFQVKKLKVYQEKREAVETKINNYRESINKELSNLGKYLDKKTVN